MLTSTDQEVDPDEIARTFAAAKGIDTEDCTAVYEHGQWWIIVDDEAAERAGIATTHSVVDAQRPSGEDYLDFEEL